MNLRLDTKREENILAYALSRKDEGIGFTVLFPFYNVTRWKKQTLNGTKIRSYAMSFNNYKRTQMQ